MKFLIPQEKQEAGLEAKSYVEACKDFSEKHFILNGRKRLYQFTDEGLAKMVEMLFELWEQDKTLAQ